MLVYNMQNGAGLHVYAHTARGVWTQELSAVHMYALQTRHQREVLEKCIRCLQTVLEHVLHLAAWNTEAQATERFRHQSCFFCVHQ